MSVLKLLQTQYGLKFKDKRWLKSGVMEMETEAYEVCRYSRYIVRLEAGFEFCSRRAK